MGVPAGIVIVLPGVVPLSGPTLPGGNLFEYHRYPLSHPTSWKDGSRSERGHDETSDAAVPAASSRIFISRT
jgi:hypothetical protein